MMRSALYLNNTLSWIFIVLAHWNNSQRIDMSSHSDTSSWFRDNQSLLFLLNAACLAEKQQILFLWSLDWPNRVSNPWSTTLEESTLTITPLMRLRQVNMKKNIFFLWTFYINQCITDNIIKVYHQHTYTYFLLIFIFLTFFLTSKPQILKICTLCGIFLFCFGV